MSSIYDKAKNLLNQPVRRVKVNAKIAARTFNSFKPDRKASLVMSAAGLGLGTISLTNNLHNSEEQARKTELEVKSLNALQKIHKALAVKNGEPLA